MKTILFVFVALSLSSQASAKSCIPGPSNPGGCMGIPDTLSAHDDGSLEEHKEGRDSGGGGRDSGGGGRDSGGTGDEIVYSE